MFTHWFRLDCIDTEDISDEICLTRSHLIKWDHCAVTERSVQTDMYKTLHSVYTNSLYLFWMFSLNLVSFTYFSKVLKYPISCLTESPKSLPIFHNEPYISLSKNPVQSRRYSGRGQFHLMTPLSGVHTWQSYESLIQCPLFSLVTLLEILCMTFFIWYSIVFSVHLIFVFIFVFT